MPMSAYEWHELINVDNKLDYSWIVFTVCELNFVHFVMRNFTWSRHSALMVFWVDYFSFKFLVQMSDVLFCWACYHRLRGSASPVLTATHHSYGSPKLSDFFFRLKQNGSIGVDSRKDVPFAVKIATFHTPWSPGPLKGPNFANFWT